MCDEGGANRVTAIALSLVLSVSALLTVVEDMGQAGAWRQLLATWQESLNSKARLLLLLSADAQSKAIARSAAGGPSNGTAARRDQRPSPRQQALVMSPQRASPKAHTDKPETFIWCSACKFSNHSLWSCNQLNSKLRGITRHKNISRDAACVELYDNLLSKLKQKGDDYVAAHNKRPDHTLQSLQQRVQA